MSFTSRGLYRFDGFELDASTRVLTRNNTPIPLTPKTVDVLEYLVLNAGRIVMKDELIQAVWPNAFVEENNLTQHISALRKALADKSGWIVTYSGRGYQFTAQVQVEYPVDSLPESQPGDIFVQRVRERTHVVYEKSSLPTAPLALPAGTSSRRSIAVWWMAVAVLAGALIALATPSVWKHFAKPPQLRTVMVADFANTTGDVTFDRTLKRALEIDLEQSPYIDVMSEREAVSTLQQMGRNDTSAITPEIAKEICERSNRQVLLTGSIAAVGQEYLLMMQATDCASGKLLSGAKAEATTKEKVLAALDSVANRVRQDLGESAESLERFQVPIAQATTSSLDALEQYSTGEYLLGSMGKEENEVLPFFQRALALDPHFAMASVAIATGYFNLGEPNLAAPYYQQAFDLSNRISEKERLYIRAHYFADDIRDIQQGIRTYRMWAEVYPRDWGPWLNIAILYTQLGQFDEAISAAQHALALDQNHGIVYGVLARDYMRLNRYAEAQSTAQRALAIGKDSDLVHVTLFETGLLQQDQSALSREIAWSQGKEVEWEFLDLQALAAAREGRLKHAEELFGAAYDSAQREGLPETADDVLLDQARMELVFGLPAASRDALSRLRNHGATSLDLAILRVQLGDASVAQHYMAEHSPDTHSGTLMEYVYLPRLRAALAMERGKPLEAITALEPAMPYELADYNVLMQRAGAYLQAGQPGMAVHDYLKVLANRGVDPVSALYPLAQLGLARAYAMQNNKVVSRSEYEKFFNSWKDADMDLPILKQAHLEFARLK
jgi:DNA-binding winged helix-turn-helix (wHTH) protein/Tfp pilus assembly protein PilF